jgi:hypothetical protein
LVLQGRPRHLHWRTRGRQIHPMNARWSG